MSWSTRLDGHARFQKGVITYRDYEKVVRRRPSLPVHSELIALGRFAPREVKTSNGRRNVKGGKQEKKHEYSRYCAKSPHCPGTCGRWGCKRRFPCVAGGSPGRKICTQKRVEFS